MKAPLSLKARRHAITRIIEARFSISAFEDVRRRNPQYWGSPRNDMARGIYDQAMREKQRLVGASDDLLEAERRKGHAIPSVAPTNTAMPDRKEIFRRDCEREAGLKQRGRTVR